jgi:hypothetical protein
MKPESQLSLAETLVTPDLNIDRCMVPVFQEISVAAQPAAPVHASTVLFPD